MACSFLLLSSCSLYGCITVSLSIQPLLGCFQFGTILEIFRHLSQELIEYEIQFVNNNIDDLALINQPDLTEIYRIFTLFQGHMGHLPKQNIFWAIKNVSMDFRKLKSYRVYSLPDVRLNWNPVAGG